MLKCEKNKPNVIYVLFDDMGYGDVSALNPESAFKTPNFDKLAEEGLSFTDAHATAALCTPSRYSILTGRYNWRSCRKSGVNGGYEKSILEKGRKTIASMLKENGYNTSCIGKWHLGLDFATNEDYEPPVALEPAKGIDFSGPIANGPNAFGFDYFYGIPASTDMPPYVYIENDHVTAIPDHMTRNMDTKAFWRYGPCSPDFKHVDVLPNLTGKVLKEIEKRSMENKPFFLYFPVPAPHAPMLPLPDYVGKSGTNAYGDFVLMCDDVIGQINNKVKELRIEKNTIIILASDNGVAKVCGFEELKKCGHNPSYHFRGHKADIYEGGHRIPYIIKWPNVIKAGSSCDRVVCLCDLYATLADYLGWQISDDAAEDSISNLPLWKNPQSEDVRTYLVHQSGDGSLSIRYGDFKLEMCPGSGGWSYPMPGEETPDMPDYQLYNLKNDVGEQNNIIDKHPDLFQFLKEELKKEILSGRSTPGIPQKNTGAAVWETISWIND